MAHRIFLHQSSDFDDTANWSDATVPVTGDSFHVPEGTQSVTQNVDRTGDYFTNVTFADGYTGNWGTSGNPFICHPEKMFVYGCNQLYLTTSDDTAGGASDVVSILINQRRASSDPSVHIEGDILTLVTAIAGNIEIETSVAHELFLPRASTASVTTTGIGNDSKLRCNGGSVTDNTTITGISDGYTQVNIDGGTFVTDGFLKEIVIDSGKLDWKCNIPSGVGNFFTIGNGEHRLNGGTLDVSRSSFVVGDAGAAVFYPIFAMPGAKIITRDGVIPNIGETGFDGSTAGFLVNMGATIVTV